MRLGTPAYSSGATAIDLSLPATPAARVGRDRISLLLSTAFRPSVDRSRKETCSLASRGARESRHEMWDEMWERIPSIRWKSRKTGNYRLTMVTPTEAERQELGVWSRSAFRASAGGSGQGPSRCKRDVPPPLNFGPTTAWQVSSDGPGMLAVVQPRVVGVMRADKASKVPPNH